MRSQAWRRFSRDRAAQIGLVLCMLVVLAALLAPWLSPHDPNYQFSEGLSLEGAPLPPGPHLPARHRSAGARPALAALWGARASLLVGVLANGLAVIIGVLLGALGGLWRGAVGTLIMRFTDVMMAFPVLLLAIALTAVLRPSLWIVTW